MDELIKSAFQKVKQDLDSMREQIDNLSYSLSENQKKMSEFSRIIQELLIQTSFSPQIQEQSIPTHILQNPTPTTQIPTDNFPFRALKPQNQVFSTGNEGVPADRQTDRQTDQHTENTPFEQAVEALNSLDNIKKEIKLKFKHITEQEFLVFSAIYQLSEKAEYTDYKTLSKKLNLTESSIRDYVGKLIKKGIPVEKSKVNNKIIQLFISEDLKKVVSLSQILQLRAI
jgi:DNA-binding MarR family transcriptional regulator